MGIADTDRTLPCNRMVFDVRRDMALYQRFRQNLEPVMEQYGLDEEEREVADNHAALREDCFAPSPQPP